MSRSFRARWMRGPLGPEDCYESMWLVGSIDNAIEMLASA